MLATWKDSADENERQRYMVLTGSHNLTMAAVRHNDELVLKINGDKEIYDAYMAHWRKIRSARGPAASASADPKPQPSRPVRVRACEPMRLLQQMVSRVALTTVLACVAAVAVAPTSTLAATVGVERYEREVPVDEGTEIEVTTGVTFEAEPAEANYLTVEIGQEPPDEDGFVSDRFTFTDLSSPVTAVGPLCEQEGEHRVVCSGDDFERAVKALLGDGDDRVEVVLTATDNDSHFASAYGEDGNDTLIGGASIDHANGGPGNDEIVGGAAADNLRGGTGDDRIDGGAGADRSFGGTGSDEVHFGPQPGLDNIYDEERDSSTSNDVYVATERNGRVRYDNRRQPVRIDLAMGIAGQPGEADQLRGVRAVVGGTGDDELVGTASGQWLAGGPGADTITAGAGDDTVDGDEGADVLHGGPGDDHFGPNEDNARDVLSCGTGRDTTIVQDSRDLLRHCETSGWGDANSHTDPPVRSAFDHDFAGALPPSQ